MEQRQQLFIGGTWTSPSGDDVVEVISPHTEERIRSGSFGVNQPYSMDPAAPFGGVKASGIGRELGREGREAYTDFKAISGAPRVESVSSVD